MRTVDKLPLSYWVGSMFALLYGIMVNWLRVDNRSENSMYSPCTSFSDKVFVVVAIVCPVPVDLTYWPGQREQEQAVAIGPVFSTGCAAFEGSPFALTVFGLPPTEQTWTAHRML